LAKGLRPAYDATAGTREISQNALGGRLTAVAMNLERNAIDATHDDIFFGSDAPVAKNDATDGLGAQRSAIGGPKWKCIQRGPREPID
jgi:hypothetical protein